MINFPASEPPAESYINSFVQPPATILRWWIPGHPILVGGSVVSTDDWNHLATTYAITHCLSLDASGREFIVPDRLATVDEPDGGLPIAAERLKAACAFASSVLRGSPAHALYVQDKMGATRAAAYAYAILRSVYGMDHEEALIAVNRGMPHSNGYHWGYNDAARAHIGSVDLWIDEGGLG